MSQSNGDQERPSAFSRWFHSGDRPAAPAKPAPPPQDDDKPPVEIEYRRRRRPPTWQPPALSSRQRKMIGIGSALAIVVAAVAGIAGYQLSHQTTPVTAYFAESIGVYPGSDVRVLGVKVGTVTSTSPDGRLVKVSMALDAGVPVPAGARAIVVTSGVVADRYIQLTPAYTGGPKLAGGAVIPVSRTAVPLEVDQIYASLSKFFAALGPNGINKNGALSNLITTGAGVLRGNGKYLSTMLTQFGALNRTLGGNSANFFATVVNLAEFNSMLKRNDAQVRLAEQELSSVTGYLASDRQNLAGALSQLATALAQVQAFIAGNRALIKSNVDKLAAITSLLVAERGSLAEALSTAPLALDNLLNAYDASNKTLVGRGDLNELSLGPAAKIFGAMATLLPPGTVPVSAGELTALPPLPLPAVGTVYGTPQTGSRGGR